MNRKNRAGTSGPGSAGFLVGIGAATYAGAFERMATGLLPETRNAFVLVLRQGDHLPDGILERLRRDLPLPIENATPAQEPRPGRIYIAPPGRSIRIAAGRFVVDDADGSAHPLAPIDDLFRSLAAEYGPRAIAVLLAGAAGDVGCAAVKAAGGRVVVQLPEAGSRPRSDDFPAFGHIDAALRLGDIGDYLSRPPAATAHPGPMMPEEPAGLFRQILEGLPQPAWSADSRGLWNFCNRALRHSTGASPADFLGHGWLDRMHPDDRPALAEAWQQAVAEKLTFRTLCRLRTREGTHRRVELSAAPVVDADGRLSGWSGSLVDVQDIENLRQSLAEGEQRYRAHILERASMEAALRASEERYRSLAEHSSDWIWEVDTNGIYSYASPKVRDILGYEPDEIIGRTPFQLMPEAEARRMQILLEPIWKQRKPLRRIENINVHKDGSEVVVETTGLPFFSPSGQFQGYRGLDRDISQRRWMEDDLRESAARNQSILDSLAAHVCVLDSQGNIVTVNEPWRRFFLDNGGVEDFLPQLTGVHTNYLETCKLAFAPPAPDGEASDAARAVHDSIAAILNGGLQYFCQEYPCHGPDDQHWFLMTASPLKTAKGGAVVVHTDITQRKRAELALAEANERKRLLFDEIDDGMMIFDNALRLVEVNPGFAAMLGYGHDELLGRQPWEWDALWPTQEAFVARFPKLPDRPGRMETLHRRKDGSLYDAEVWWQPTLWRDQKMLFCIARDITDRKTAERALEESEERFRSLVENASDGFVLFRRDGSMAEVNQTACDDLGYSREELLAMHIGDIECSRPSKEILAALGRIKPGHSETVVGRHRRKDGSSFPVEVRLSYAELRGEPMLLALARDISERVAAEARLRESEQRLRKYFQTPAIGIAVLQPDSVWVDANDRLCEIAGYPRNELFARNWVELSHPEDREADRREFQRLLNGELDNYSIEKRFFRKSGAIVYTDLNVGCVRKPDGGLDYLVAFVQDITERKHMEQQLRKLTLAVEQSPEAIFITDTDARIEYVNEAFVRSTGYTREEVLGRNPRLLQSGETPQERYRDLWAALTRGRFWQGEFINRRKNGETWVAHEIFWPVREEDGDITHFLAISQDITERQRLQAELDRYRERLEQWVEERTRQLQLANRDLAEQAEEIRDLYDNAPCGYHSVRRDGSIVTINSTELALLGYDRQEIEGRNYRELVAPESRKIFDRKMATLQTKGQIRNLEYDLLRKDGSRLPVVVNATAVYANDGTFLHDRATLFDDRERRDHDRQVALLNAELLRRAATANADNAAKSEFLAGLSHEIRTPLSAIRLTIGLLATTTLSDYQRDHLVRCEAALDGLVGIIDDVLDFSKIEAGRLRLETAEVDLERLAEDLGLMFAEQAEKKGIELLFDTDWNLPRFLLGDPLRLSQILNNLISNAVKFSDGGTILVSFREQARDGGQITLACTVRDDGIGIGKDQQQHIFRPFFQADSSTTRRLEGTGLGLAICRRLVDLMGGQIGIDSEPGRGSTFYFSVRLDLPEADGQPAFPPLAGPGHRQAVVVDGNPEVRRVLAEQLARLGFRPETFATLAEAVPWVRQGSADGIVLLDERLAAGSGNGLRPASIRAAGGALPHILLLGHPSLGGAAASLRRQGYPRLQKPVTRLRLHEQIVAALSPLQPSPKVAEDALAALARGLRGAVILVVEDNHANRELLGDILRSQGLRVQFAGNGLEALAAVDAARPDAILMDCRMPVMDGYETTRRLRDQEQTRDLPIIALTAHALSSDRQRCLEAGMTAFLSKPFNILKLMTILSQWIPPRNPDDNAPAAPAAETAELPELPGIDVAGGLRRVSHKQALYVKLLRKFRDTHLPGFTSDFETALDGADWTTATRLAHSLKGTSRTLGADALGDAAAALEAATRFNDRAVLSEPLAALQDQLRQVADVLNRLG